MAQSGQDRETEQDLREQLLTHNNPDLLRRTHNGMVQNGIIDPQIAGSMQHHELPPPGHLGPGPNQYSHGIGGTTEEVPGGGLMMSGYTLDNSPLNQKTEKRESTSKREVANTKRAAQNRAAQRAFRMRKEEHIRQLEIQVADYQNLLSTLKLVQAENYTLRDYIISLQGRLIEAHTEVPPPPENVRISLNAMAETANGLVPS